jgi:hypothetical protein
MPKFTLIAEHTNWYTGKVESKVTYEFEADGISDVLQNTDLFLRGVGYFPNGTLDYIPDEEYYGTPSETETEESSWNGHAGMGSTAEDYPELYDEIDILKGKSHYYFDTERNK